jgi:microcystin-dependent protein
MSTPYLGQIQTFSFNFPPKGWALCNGQILPISQNQALFALLGTFYGGNGTNTFALPNFQGSFGLGWGTAPGSGIQYVIGQTAGEINHTLITGEMMGHTHPMIACSIKGSSGTPINNFPAQAANSATLFSNTTDTTLGTGSSPAGGNAPHNNMPPYLVINVCIALVGIFPSRN